MKRPMMVLAAVWLSGLLAGRFGPPGCRVIFLCSYITIILIFLMAVSHRPSILFPYVKQERYVQMTLFFLMLPVLFFAGVARQASYEENIQEKLAPWQQLEDRGENYVFVVGTITEKTTGEQIELILSDCMICGYEEKGTSEEAGVYSLRENAGGDGTDPVGFKAAGDCQVTIEKEGERGISESCIGNRVRVYGKFYLYDTAGNPGQFDAAEYYHGKGLFASVRAMRLDVLATDISVFRHMLFLLRCELRETLLELYPEEKAGVLAAMLMGDKELLAPDIKELYQQNGISHLLAISGLHISMLCMGLFRVLRRIGLSLRLSAAFGLLFLGFYVVFSGAGTSSLRAGIMCVVLLGAKLLRRSYDLLSSLSLAAILVTALRPQEMTSAGFLLSFGAVLGVAVGQKVQTVLAEAVIGSLAFGVALQLVTIPISLWFFYELSPYSIFLNLILIPLASFVLGGGILSVLVGLFAPMFAKLCAGGVYLILDFYEWMGRLVQKLPYSFMLIGQPRMWQIIVYYCFLAVVVWSVVSAGKGKEREAQIGKRLSWGKWIEKCAEHGRVVSVTALIGSLLILFLPQKETFELSFLDVSQGDGILLQTQEGEVFLFDGGSTDVNSVGTYRISPVLKQKGIALIDTVTISHLDSDHYSGVLEILEAMPVYEGKRAFLRQYCGNIGICHLVLPKVQKPSETYLELVALATEKRVTVSYIEEGEMLYEERELLIECLSPKDAIESENDTSLVFLIQTPDLVVWMMGDAGVDTEAAIMRKLREDFRETLSEKYCVLKVGHHGSSTSSSKEFLSFIQPEAAVISCGYKNSYGHPHESVLDNLAGTGCVVYRTDLQGYVRFEADRHGKLQIRGYLPD